MQINFLTNSNDKSTKSNKQNQGKTSFKINLVSSEFLQKNAKLFDKEILKTTEFEAKFLQSLTVAKDNNIEIYLGCGLENKLSVIQLNKIGARILSLANASKFADIAVEFCFKISAQSLSDIAFGAVLQSYRFNKYFNKKIKDKELKIANLNFFHEKASEAKKLFASEQILAENIFMVRDLVSEPSNILNPESYADFCKNLKVKNLEIEILGEKEMTKLGMNSLLGVGVGSQRESKMVILKYNGGKKDEAPLAFIGKGVTFDTGGISIKPANNMEDMKTDMAGSAVVVGLLKNLAQRNAKVNAVGLIGLVENMPSG
ncbi:MAG: leucyl aminopeptidase family protein, partial [Alphaproteobacteria bacterium]